MKVFLVVLECWFTFDVLVVWLVWRWSSAPLASGVHPASGEWGCAVGCCHRPACVVVTSPRGSRWGACERHVKQVRKALRNA